MKKHGYPARSSLVPFVVVICYCVVLRTSAYSAYGHRQRHDPDNDVSMV